MPGTKRESSAEEDKFWIQKYRTSGDVDYFGKLYAKYKQRIFLSCLKRVNDEEEAKDLTSEAFIKAFDHVDDFKEDAPFFPWLYRIATNLCIDHLRKQSRFRYHLLDESRVAKNPDEERQVENQKELRSKIPVALRKLKQAQRRCFCLFYINNLSYNEIAEITGYSYNQVRSHIQNGRRRFKIILEQL
ncbi:MAG: RNA polymerase sigma factor [bacterium]